MKHSIKYIFWNILRKLGLGPNPLECPEIKTMIETAKKNGKAGFVLKLEIFEDGEWLVTSQELPGLVTGGSLKERNNIEEQVIDAIFTYFAVPPRYCDDTLFLGERKVKHQVKLPLQLIPATA